MQGNRCKLARQLGRTLQVPMLRGGMYVEFRIAHFHFNRAQ